MSRLRPKDPSEVEAIKRVLQLVEMWQRTQFDVARELKLALEASPQQFRSRISVPYSVLRLAYHGVDVRPERFEIDCHRRIVSFTSNKSVAYLFGNLILQGTCLETYSHTLNTEQLALYAVRYADVEIGDDEGEILVLGAVFKNLRSP